MKARSFFQVSLWYTLAFALALLLPVLGIAWLVGNLTHPLVLLAASTVLIFAVPFGLVSGALNHEQSRVFRYVDEEEFLADLNVALSIQGFTLMYHSGATRAFHRRLQRLVVTSTPTDAEVVATPALLSTLRLPSVVYADARLLMLEGEYAHAVPMLEEVLRHKPHMGEAQQSLEEAYAHLDGTDAAYLTAAPVEHKRMLLLWLGANVLHHINRTLDHQPAVGVLMGDSHDQREWDVTRADVLWAMEVSVVAEQAHEAGKRGDFVSAIHLYKQALQQAPGCDLYLMSIGVGYHQLGERGKALDYLHRAAEISPDNARIRENLRLAEQAPA